MSGTRRWPLWTTLIPLGVGAIVWFVVWQGYRDRLADALAAILPPGTPVAVGGFPYRLEARFGPVDIERRDTALFARLEAREVVVNRQPWRLDRQVISLDAPKLVAGLSPLERITARVVAPSAQASLRTAEGRVARLSIVWEMPQVSLGFLPVPIAAQSLEAHVRETPSKVPGAGPGLPVQAEAVVQGQGLRLGAGTPVDLTAAFELRAGKAVAGLASWQEGGEVQLRDLVISDATGEVLRLSARLSPGPDGAVRAVGRIETVCPASVRTALLGGPPVTEKRARKPVEIGIDALLGQAVRLSPPPEAPVPVRGQAPDCPRLR